MNSNLEAKLLRKEQNQFLLMFKQHNSCVNNQGSYAVIIENRKYCTVFKPNTGQKCIFAGSEEITPMGERYICNWKHWQDEELYNTTGVRSDD